MSKEEEKNTLRCKFCNKILHSMIEKCDCEESIKNDKLLLKEVFLMKEKNINFI